MSIWTQTWGIAAAATLPASLSATTAATSRPVVPLEVFAMSGLLWGTLLAAGLLLGFATLGGRPPRWAPPRAAGGAASGPLWVGAAVMAWCFLATPTIGVAALAGLGGAPGEPLGDGAQMLLYTATYASGFVGVTLLHALWRGRRTASMLGLDVSAPRAMALVRAAVLVLVAIALTNVAATLTALAWQLLRLEHESAHALLQLMERNESTPWVLIVAAINATVLAPLFEELLFRGHLQTAIGASLPRVAAGGIGDRWPAILITSGLFAAIHEPWTMPPIFVLSVAIGVAYEWTGKLWVAIAMHVAFNATSTALFLIARG